MLSVLTYSLCSIPFILALVQLSIWFRFRSVSRPWRTMPGDSIFRFFPYGALRRVNFIGRKFSKKYGDLYHVQFFLKPVVVLASSKVAAEFYRVNPKAVTRRTNMETMGPIFERVQQNALGGKTGRAWTHTISAYKANFSPRGVAENIEIIAEEIEKWSRENLHDGAVIDFMASNLYRLPFNIFCKAFYGVFLETEEDRSKALNFARTMGEFLAESSSSIMLNMFPASILLPLDSKRKCDNFLKDWNSFNEECYRKLQQGQVPLNKAGLFGLVLEHHFGQVLPPLERASKDILNETWDTFSELLLVNNEVTNAVLMTSLALVATKKEAIAELCSELKQINSMSEWEQLDKLPFMEACIKESFRLKALHSLTLAETVGDDIILGGYRIPAGTAICCDVDSINHDPAVWGDDADDFNPSRFLGRDRAFEYLRFGFNPRRQCLGYRYAESIVKICTWRILREFNVKISEQDMKRWMTEEKSFGIPQLTPFMSFPKLHLKKH